MLDRPTGGAPTKYKPEYCQKIIEFFSGDPYEQFKDAEGNPTDFPPKLPTIERFADYLGVVKSTIYEWTKKHPEFSNAVEISKQKERLFLNDAGLASIYDRGYTLLIRNLNNHGMPRIHNCKTLRIKIKKIQEAYSAGDITHIQSEKLIDQVRAEGQIIELSDIDERLKKIEKAEK